MSGQHPQPATILGELLSKINELMELSHVDDITLGGLKRDAKKLQRAVPHEGHVALGALAALDWNVEEVHRHYRNALRVVDNSDVRTAYGVALESTGQLLEALEQYSVAFEFEPEDGSTLRSTFSCATASGSFSQARELIARWNRSFPDRSIVEPKSLNLLESAFDEVRRQGLHEEQIQQSLGLAYEMCRQRRTRTKGLTMNLVPTGDANRKWDIVSMLHVRASTEQAASMSMELFDKVYDYPDLLEHAWRGFLVSFTGESDDACIAN